MFGNEPLEVHRIIEYHTENNYSIVEYEPLIRL